MEQKAAAVFDNGSAFLKAGFAGEQKPKAVMRTVLGFPRGEKGVALCGRQALQTEWPKKALVHPVEVGVVRKWEEMEKLWEHVYDRELRIDPAAQPAVHVVRSPPRPAALAKAAQVVFEQLGAPSLAFVDSGLMALYATARFSGVCVDFGDSCTTLTAYDGGVRNREAVAVCPFGGQHVAEELLALLDAKGIKLRGIGGLEYARQIKEQFAYVALDPQAEALKTQADPLASNRGFEMPDGKSIFVGAPERFMCVERLLDRAKGGATPPSASLATVVAATPVERHGDMLRNVVFSGGDARLPGLVERFVRDARRSLPEGKPAPVVTVAPDPEFASWLGASILSSVPGASQFVSKQQWQESGDRLFD